MTFWWTYREHLFVGWLLLGLLFDAIVFLAIQTSFSERNGRKEVMATRPILGLPVHGDDTTTTNPPISPTPPPIPSIPQPILDALSTLQAKQDAVAQSYATKVQNDAALVTAQTTKKTSDDALAAADQDLANQLQTVIGLLQGQYTQK